MVKNNQCAIGIDIGGTKISAAVVQNGQITSEVLSYKTPDNTNDILNTILEVIETLTSRYHAKFVGIATAGAVNLENSKVAGSTGNLPDGYSDLELRKIIEERFNAKVFVENDANAAAYAEYKIGNGKGDNNVIVITLGTGVGGGIIINGKLLRGKSGVAAEVGHIPICCDKKRRCTCGDWDCWEAYASGTGYALNAREMAKAIPQEERVGMLKGKNVSKLTTYDIIKGLPSDDPFAKKVHQKWESYVIMGLLALVNIFDPDSIILSGGMAKFINFSKMEKELNERTVISQVKLLPAKTENYAGIIGAAMLASE